MDAIKESMVELSTVFHQKFAEFEERQRKVSSSTPTDDSRLAEEFSSFKVFTIQALRTLQTQVELIARRNDDLEMHTRRKILLIHGIPESKDEDTAAVIARTINEKLKLSDFVAANISRCHRMGRSSTLDRPRPILFKLCDMALRGKIWGLKTSLKGSGITLSEFLTKSRHDTFVAARQRFGVTKCWTRDGSIYVVKADGTRMRLVSMAELDAIAEPAPVAEAATAPEKLAKKQATRRRAAAGAGANKK